MRKLSTDEKILVGCIAVGSACMVMGLIGWAQEKRKAERDRQEQLSRNIAHASAMEKLEMVDEHLKRQLNIARAVMLELDIEEIFDSMGEE